MNEPTDDHSPIFGHIEGEHKQMRAMLHDVHDVLAARTESVASVKESLDSMLVYLQEHFQHEDEGGFFDEISSRSPRLSDQASDVSHEHAGLLTMFFEFTKQAGAGDGSSEWWENLNTKFVRISKELMQHERREQDLLQQTFTDDIGECD